MAIQGASRARFNNTGSSVLLAPRESNAVEKYEFYKELVNQTGAKLNRDGLPTVLALRGVDPQTGQRHTSVAQLAYDDLMVVLKVDGTMVEFPASTHGGFAAPEHAFDTDKDGKGDGASVQPGEYFLEPTHEQFGGHALRMFTLGGSDSIPIFRDRNQDGFISATEKSRMNATTGLLLHQDVSKSIGCQTIAPELWGQFVDAIGGRKARVHYVLVDASSP